MGDAGVSDQQVLTSGVQARRLDLPEPLAVFDDHSHVCQRVPPSAQRCPVQRSALPAAADAQALLDDPAPPPRECAQGVDTGPLFGGDLARCESVVEAA